jgi:hypothetical protein
MANTGVYTNDFRQELASVAAGDALTYSLLYGDLPNIWFGVGEGGWEIANGSKVPKAPPAGQVQLDSTIRFDAAAGSLSSTGVMFFKQIPQGDITKIDANTIEFVCRLAANEAGLDSNSHLNGNQGGDPHIFELGIFNGKNGGTAVAQPQLNGDPIGPGVLMAYCTFDEIVKTVGKSVTITIRVTY